MSKILLFLQKIVLETPPCLKSTILILYNSKMWAASVRMFCRLSEPWGEWWWQQFAAPKFPNGSCNSAILPWFWAFSAPKLLHKSFFSNTNPAASTNMFTDITQVNYFWGPALSLTGWFHWKSPVWSTERGSFPGGVHCWDKSCCVSPGQKPLLNPPLTGLILATTEAENRIFTIAEGCYFFLVSAFFFQVIQILSVFCNDFFFPGSLVLFSAPI